MDEIKKLVNDIKGGKISPVYFLAGEEPYYIDKFCEFIEGNILDPTERDFNQMVLYGRDISIDELISHAKRFPMMAERQVIVVKEAQHLSRTIDQLESYVLNPQPTTVLVLCYKYSKLDKRKKVYKAVQQHGVYFESNPIKEYQVADWIRKVMAGSGYTVQPKASEMLVEFLGNDLSKISKELDKLKILVKSDTPVTPELIETNIGISKDYNNFELKKAISSRDMVKAVKIAQYFESDPRNHPVIVTISLLYSFFSQLLQYHSLSNPAQAQSVLKIHNTYALAELKEAASYYPMKKVSQIVNHLREADLKVKGVGVSSLGQDSILKELLVKIMA